MAPSGNSLIVCIAIAVVTSSRAARVRVQEQIHTGESVESSTDSALHCAESVAGSVIRECANRAYLTNTCRKNRVCKCPIYARLQGEDAICDADLYDDGRKFDPEQLAGKGCKCVTPKWVPTDRKVPTLKCPKQSFFKTVRPELPDLAETVMQWCNPNDVPKDKLLPKSLRGLYWMKDANPQGVAFCTTRAEWDPATLTAKLSPWTDFVFRKYDNETAPPMLDLMKKMGLVYVLKFRNDSMTYADIGADVDPELAYKIVKLPMTISKAFADMPLIEVNRTDDADGFVSTHKGDIFSRPTNVFGKQMARYYAVRIADEFGNINRDWYSKMAEAKAEPNASFVHYEQDC